jgi:hypothetical protein
VALKVEDARDVVDEANVRMGCWGSEGGLL